MTDPDQSYTDASIEAMGRTCAQFFTSLCQNGMSRSEALELVKAWVAAVAARPSEPKDPDA